MKHKNLPPEPDGIRFRQLCGVQIAEDGQFAAVWLRVNPVTDVVTLYHSLLMNREVLALRAQAIRAAGKWIPVAWPKSAEAVAEKLLYDHEVNMLPDPVDDSDAMAEMLSLDLLERMRTKRFQVARDQVDWQKEFQTFQRRDQKVPRNSHPLMAATRHAVAMLDFAVVNPGAGAGSNAPRLNFV